MIEYYVQSIPQRRELRERLLASIPPAVPVEDDGPPPPNPWRGYQLCMRAFFASAATHAVIVQDDVAVCRNFGAVVEQIVENVPDLPICLFTPGVKSHSIKIYRKAMLAKQTYAIRWFQDFMPVVATIWPREKALHFMNWSKDAKLPGLPDPRSDDAVAGSWMKFNKEIVLSTVPSLVEHPNDTPSFAQCERPLGKDATRQAYWYIGDEDPLKYDWSFV